MSRHESANTNGDSIRPELIAQAVTIEGLIRHMSEKPDWEQTNIRFVAPLGLNNQLELLARVSSDDDTNSFRQINILENNPDNHRYFKFMMDLDDITKHQGRYPYRIDLNKLITDAPDAEYEIVEFLHDAFDVHLHGPKPEVVTRLNLGYAALLDKGSTDLRRGVRHTLADDTKVYMGLFEKEGKQPWAEIDDAAEVQLRIRTSRRIVDFMSYRNGRFETYDCDPNTGQALKSIVGDDQVVRIGDTDVEFDLGGNAAKKAVVAEAERAMGWRDLDAERLAYIEPALWQAFQNRS